MPAACKPADRSAQGCVGHSDKLLACENDSSCFLAYHLHLVRHQARVADILRIQPRFVHPRSDLRGLQDPEGLATK